MSNYENGIIDFTTDDPQVYRCRWENKDLTVIYTGICEHCGKRTYEFENSNSDPRGPLGMRIPDPFVASEFDMKGRDVLVCWECGNNDAVTYEVALSIAKERWS